MAVQSSADSENPGAGQPTADEVQAPEGPVRDTLLDCLVFLCRHHGKPKSPSVIKAQLPEYGSAMPTDLFLRAAESHGFKVAPFERTLESIPTEVLPAVVVFNDQTAGLLLAKGDGEEPWTVVLPAEGETETKRTLDELNGEYSGCAFFVAPVTAFGSHDKAMTVPNPRAWFWETMRESWWTYSQVLMAAVLVNFFALASPLFVMNVYDRVLPNDAIETGWVLAIGAATVFLFDLLLRNLRGVFIDFAGKRADVIISCRIFDHMLNMRLAHRAGSSGGTASVMREFESVREVFTSATLTTLVDLPFAFLFVAVIALINPVLGGIVVAAVLLVLAVGLVIQIPLDRIMQKHMAQSEHKHGVLVESINGLETIKAVGGAGRMRAIWENLVELTAETHKQSRFVSNLSVNSIMFIQQFTTIVAVLAGIYLVREGDLTAGGLIASVILTGRAIAPMSQVSQLMTRFHHARISLRAIDGLMSKPVDRPADRTFLHRPNLKGEITLDEVCFAYPESEVPVLDNIHVRIAAGEKVGIVGRVGSGKSTLAKLIAGLYEPSSGTIRVDGTDMQQIEPVDIRKAVGYVPQDLFLFRGTLKENIALTDPQASDERIVEVAKLSGLDDFVNSHPMGFDMPVGERGEGLSGGQRQLTALSRAVLPDPAIYVLDEPTSSTDTRTEAQLISNLPHVIGDSTLVLITHRASLLKLTDRLLVLDRGRVVADGPRENVLKALADGRIGAAA